MEPRTRLSWRIENVRSGASADVQIYGGIGDPWDGVDSATFNSEVRDLDTQVERINFLMNSPGGYVNDGLAMYHAIQGLKADTWGYVEGSADSAASFVLQAMKNRVIAKSASMFIHRAQGIAIGDEDDAFALYEMLKENSLTIATIYAERAGGTADEWLERMSAGNSAMRGTQYRGQQAVDIALADEVGIYSRNQIPTRIAATTESVEPADVIDLSLIPPLANGYKPPLPTDFTRLVAANLSVAPQGAK